MTSPNARRTDSARAEERLPSIGFLGPGAMGAGMVTRLLSHGYGVRVWARRPEKARPFEELGATAELLPADVVAKSQIVLGCLLDSEVIRRLYLGSDESEGIAAHAREGQVFVEHATFDPSLAAEIADALRSRGADFLDSPVSGGPSGALAGTLVTMVGGGEGSLARIEPVIRSYCARVKRAGDVGSGLRLKLVNQLLVCTHAVAAAEASALVLRNDIDPETAHEALMGGWAASTMLDLQLPKACAGDFSSGGANVGGLLEVQRLVSELAESSGIRSEMLQPVRRVFQAVTDGGRGQEGLATLVNHYLSGG
jgi:3-hydroxyisobutyrate dehydrogenase-like beta-hydroxyacid dehydrogenase